MQSYFLIASILASTSTHSMLKRITKRPYAYQNLGLPSKQTSTSPQFNSDNTERNPSKEETPQSGIGIEALIKQSIIDLQSKIKTLYDSMSTEETGSLESRNIETNLYSFLQTFTKDTLLETSSVQKTIMNLYSIENNTSLNEIFDTALQKSLESLTSKKSIDSIKIEVENTWYEQLAQVFLLSIDPELNEYKEKSTEERKEKKNQILELINKSATENNKLTDAVKSELSRILDLDQIDKQKEEELEKPKIKSIDIKPMMSQKEASQAYTKQQEGQISTEKKDTAQEKQKPQAPEAKKPKITIKDIENSYTKILDNPLTPEPIKQQIQKIKPYIQKYESAKHEIKSIKKKTSNTKEKTTEIIKDTERLKQEAFKLDIQKNQLPTEEIEKLTKENEQKESLLKQEIKNLEEQKRFLEKEIKTIQDILLLNKGFSVENLDKIKKAFEESTYSKEKILDDYQKLLYQINELLENIKN